MTNPGRRIWVLPLLLAGCSGIGSPPSPTVDPGVGAENTAEPADEPAGAEPRPVAVEPPEALPWPEATLRSLGLRDKIAQMMMPFTLGNFTPKGTDGHDRVSRWVEELGVGGVIMSVGAPTDVAAKINDLQSHARIPLLVAADLEAGAGFRFSGAVHVRTNIALGGATTFPSLMAVGATRDPQAAYELGRITAVEARAMGVHIPFAPVLDVNNNPANPIINIRSFGEDPELVSRLGSAFVRGVEDHGAVATGKHFPGHGDTEVDSHIALPVIPVGRARLDSIELVPFRAAIESGMRAVMTAHIALPELTGDIPSTLSEAVLGGILRRDLGFDGLIFTDAMDMAAVDRRFPRGEATVRAIEAGADVILMPPDIEVAIDAVEEAVRSGRLSEWRIDRTVLKLLELKHELGLDGERMVPIEGVMERVGIPEHTGVAEDVAERSITLIRNGRNLLPLLGTRSARVLSITYRPRNHLLSGRYFDARVRATYPRLVSGTLDGDTNPAVYEGLLRQARRSNLVVVSVYSNFAGRIDLTDEAIEFVNELAASGIPHLVISFGNPYLIDEFPDIQAYMLAWGSAPVSQSAAARSLFGEFPITGRSPVSAPPHFEIGAGWTIPPLESAVGGG